MSVSKAPTVGEANFMFAVLESNAGPLKIAWDQVATKTGLKNGRIASIRFGQIKKKLGWTSTAGVSRSAFRVVKSCSPARPSNGGAGRGGRKPAARKGPTKGAGRGAKGKKIKDDAEDESVAEESKTEKKEVEATIDLIAGSEDEEDEEDEEPEEESSESKVICGVHDEDSEKEGEDDLSGDTVAQPQEEEYDAYGPDAGAEDEQAPVERQLYIPDHA